MLEKDSSPTSFSSKLTGGALRPFQATREGIGLGFTGIRDTAIH